MRWPLAAAANPGRLLSVLSIAAGQYLISCVAACTEAVPDGAASASEEPGTSSVNLAGDNSEPRDREMEESLAHSVSGDPLAAYDVDVQEEGQAIKQFLALIDAQQQTPPA